jgi:hypothetical protein
MTARGSLVAGPIGVSRKDRTLTAFSDEAAVRWGTDPGQYAFYLGFTSIILTFLLPGSWLTHLGLYSDAPGGNALTKFHPATYMAVVAAWAAISSRSSGGGINRLFRERPALSWATILILFCMLYSLLNIGVGGLALYVETYLAAAMVAIAIDKATERQCQILGYTILILTLGNVAIALIEARLQTHLQPEQELQLTAADAKYLQQVEEFRGQALFPHPLTGSLVTSMALFLILGMRLRRWLVATILVTLLVGLLSFGGRGAFAVTVMMIAAAALFQLASGLVTRRLNIGFLAAFVAGALLLPALFIAITTHSDIGMRLTSHFYMDDSADVRMLQWRVLDLLRLRDVLFGMAPDRIELLKANVGLADVGSDIENPWLLLFLDLGIVACPFLVAAIFLLLLHLGRQANNSMSWLLITASLLIVSTSNSLGRRTPDLIFLTAFAVALRTVRSEEHQPIEAPAAAPQPAVEGFLGLVPQHRQRSLTERPITQRASSSVQP